MLSACGKIIQPYDTKFKCPPTYLGVCEPMEDAYKDSVLGIDPRKFDKEWVEKRKEWEKEHRELLEARRRAELQLQALYNSTNVQIDVDKALGISNSKVAKEYRKELFSELHSLITEPKTPFVAPPKIVRVLVLSTIAPEENDRTIFISPRYVYFMLDSPKWIIHKLPEYVPFDPANPMLRFNQKVPTTSLKESLKQKKQTKFDQSKNDYELQGKIIKMQKQGRIIKMQKEDLEQVEKQKEIYFQKNGQE